MKLTSFAVLSLALLFLRGVYCGLPYRSHNGDLQPQKEHQTRTHISIPVDSFLRTRKYFSAAGFKELQSLLYNNRHKLLNKVKDVKIIDSNSDQSNAAITESIRKIIEPDYIYEYENPDDYDEDSEQVKAEEPVTPPVSLTTRIANMNIMPTTVPKRYYIHNRPYELVQEPNAENTEHRPTSQTYANFNPVHPTKNDYELVDSFHDIQEFIPNENKNGGSQINYIPLEATVGETSDQYYALNDEDYSTYEYFVIQEFKDDSFIQQDGNKKEQDMYISDIDQKVIDDFLVGPDGSNNEQVTSKYENIQNIKNEIIHLNKEASEVQLGPINIEKTDQEPSSELSQLSTAEPSSYTVTVPSITQIFNDNFTSDEQIQQTTTPLIHVPIDTSLLTESDISNDEFLTKPPLIEIATDNIDHETLQSILSALQKHFPLENVTSSFFEDEISSTTQNAQENETEEPEHDLQIIFEDQRPETMYDLENYGENYDNEHVNVSIIFQNTNLTEFNVTDEDFIITSAEEISTTLLPEEQSELIFGIPKNVIETELPSAGEIISPEETTFKISIAISDKNEELSLPPHLLELSKLLDKHSAYQSDTDTTIAFHTNDGIEDDAVVSAENIGTKSPESVAITGIVNDQETNNFNESLKQSISTDNGELDVNVESINDSYNDHSFPSISDMIANMFGISNPFAGFIFSGASNQNGAFTSRTLDSSTTLQSLLDQPTEYGDNRDYFTTIFSDTGNEEPLPVTTEYHALPTTDSVSTDVGFEEVTTQFTANIKEDNYELDKSTSVHQQIPFSVDTIEYYDHISEDTIKQKLVNKLSDRIYSTPPSSFTTNTDAIEEFESTTTYSNDSNKITSEETDRSIMESSEVAYNDSYNEVKVDKPHPLSEDIGPTTTEIATKNVSNDDEPKAPSYFISAYFDDDLKDEANELSPTERQTVSEISENRLASTSEPSSPSSTQSTVKTSTAGRVIPPRTSENFIRVSNSEESPSSYGKPSLLASLNVLGRNSASGFSHTKETLAITRSICTAASTAAMPKSQSVKFILQKCAIFKISGLL